MSLQMHSDLGICTPPPTPSLYTQSLYSVNTVLKADPESRFASFAAVVRCGADKMTDPDGICSFSKHMVDAHFMVSNSVTLSYSSVKKTAESRKNHPGVLRMYFGVGTEWGGGWFLGFSSFVFPTCGQQNVGMPIEMYRSICLAVPLPFLP